jgi:phospholipid/cholesterol/gamma-HCH transport system substrate-binding protein
VRKRAISALPATIRALDVSQDDVAFLRPYTPDILGWLTKFGQSTAYYNADGQYARVMPAGANPFDYVDGPTDTLTGNYQAAFPPVDARQFPVADALPYVATPNASNQRCPGAGSAPAPDDSNPFVQPDWPEGLPASGCTPSWMPPGPLP